MISYDRKFFAIKIIFKIFYGPRHSKEFKFIDAVAFFITIQKSRCKKIGFQPLIVNCSNAVRMPERDAPHFIRVSSCGL